MHANAPNPNCAYKWLNHSINQRDPGRSGGLVRNGSGSPVGLRRQRTARTGGLRHQRPDNFDQIKFWQTPTEDCLGAGGTCVPYYKWVTDYLAVIGGR